MIRRMKSALGKGNGALWQDAIGGMSLMVILLGALYLPVLM